MNISTQQQRNPSAAYTVTGLSLTSHVTAPVKGNPPLTSFDTTEYNGSIAWKNASGGDHSGAFAPYTIYKAAVTLSAKAGYAFNGVGGQMFLYTLTQQLAE
ncbi:hypothetical protein AGMMS50229_18210 [Campylobacterota bacterium]|nr:hypothetical protein AGMMS50229_18210 [Campylobacterota bacterium]